METIKNFLAIIFSTVSWLAGIIALFSVYQIIFKFDTFGFVTLCISLAIIGFAVLLARYSERIKTALQFPFGFLLQ
jgi:hypothetical protein